MNVLLALLLQQVVYLINHNIDWKLASAPSTSVILSSKRQCEIFINLIELLILLTDNTSKSHVIIYQPDSSEQSSLSFKMQAGDESTPILLFPSKQLQHKLVLVETGIKESAES